MCALRSVKSFLGVFPSDLLPRSIPQHDSTVIIYADPHTKSGSHWLAIRFEPGSSKAFYFDSFGQQPHITNIQDFLRSNSTVKEYNTVRLQGPTTTLCGKYCCLFAFHMYRGFSRKHFVSLFDPSVADGMVKHLFIFVFGRLVKICGGKSCTSANNRCHISLLKGDLQSCTSF